MSTLGKNLGRKRTQIAGLFTHTEQDEEYVAGRERFEKLHKSVEVIERKLRKFIKVVDEIGKPMLKLGQSFQSFYGELDSNQHATKYITTTNRISDAAKTFTLSMHELCADVHVLSKTMTQIRKSITERDDALVEYTRADNNLKAILKKEEPTHPKANKAQLKHQECKVRYENLNSELKSKFADYDSNRAIHIQSYFAKLVKIQARFFSIAAKACEDLESQTSDSPSSSLRSSSPTTSASPSPRPQHPSLPSPRSQTISSPSPSPFAVAPSSLSSSQHPSDPFSNDAFPTAPNVNPYYSGGGVASRKERRKSWDSPRSSRRFEPEQLDSSQPNESYSPSPSPPSSYKSAAPLVPPLPQLPQQPPQQQQQHSFSSFSSSQRMPSPRREAPLPQPPSPHRPPQPQPQPHPYRNSTTVAAAAMPAYPPPPRREPPPRPPRRNTTLGHM